jgi:hypothetical protein
VVTSQPGFALIRAWTASIWGGGPLSSPVSLFWPAVVVGAGGNACSYPSSMSWPPCSSSLRWPAVAVGGPGRGVVEWYGKVAAAWCWGLLCSVRETLPPNKAVLWACRSDEPSHLALCGSGRRYDQRLTGSPRVLLLLLAGLGDEGEEEDYPVRLPCWRWSGACFELIIADAFYASVILCRQGGNYSTSMLEALARHCRGCSSSPRGEMIRSPLRGKGPRWMSVVGRGSRAAGPCSSAATPRGRRRTVATALRDMFASYPFVPGCFL